MNNLRVICKKHYKVKYSSMKEICKLDECMGCTACLNICPKQAIIMFPDEFGFLYPKIDLNKCIECGLCKDVCPAINESILRFPKDCYAVTEKNENDLLSVASGGAATIISRFILSKGGVVYGCCGDNIRHVHHIRIDSIQELDRLKGSKYVQSDLGHIFLQIKNDLKKNIKILFIGTPCQVAGLYSFLRNKDYANLYTADLVCHGVPSQKMLNENIDNYVQSDNKDYWVSFRNKSKILTSDSEDDKWKIVYEWRLGEYTLNGKLTHIVTNAMKDPYMTGFLNCLTLRPNCFSCKFACAARCGDFTLADFWGLKTDIGFENGKGVSLNLINTSKGLQLWSEISPSCNYLKRDILEGIWGNGRLQRPGAVPITYQLFRKLYPKVGLKKAVNIANKEIKLRCSIQAFLIYIEKVIVKLAKFFHYLKNE